MKLYALGLCAGLALATPFSLLAAEPAKKAPAEKAAAEKPNLVAPDVVKAMGELVKQGVQLASAPLQTSDDFEPYAVLQRKDGSLQRVRYQKPETPSANPPSASEIFKRVTLSVLDVTRKDPDVVAAVTFASTMSPTSDGKTKVPMIRAEVDHREGAPLIVLMPFQRTKEGKLEFGSTPSLPGSNFLFFRDDSGKAIVAAPEAAPAAAPAAATPASAPATKK